MSNSLVLRKRDGTPIHDLNDWTRPKQERQWKEGRSAMELGRAWLVSGAPQTPTAIEELLASDALTQGARFHDGFPEFVTALPERGEGRNHDLMLLGKQNDESLTACIEAKADEPFGEVIGELYRKAKKKHLITRTRSPERVESLLKLVFGVHASATEKPWSELRYQLLTGFAGTLLQSQKNQTQRGLFIVHEFHGHEVNPDKIRLNAHDYAQFVEAVFDVPYLEVKSGVFYGPKTFIALDLPIAILVGKAISQLDYE